LPVAARKVLELRFLADLPPYEVAQRLGLTVNALDVRLHRARNQLRQALNGPLRADAAAFGLALSGEEEIGWRETRLWCMFCGHHHLQGRLDVALDGRTNLQMRCPQCSQRIGAPRNGLLTESGPLDTLRGLRSFRPAFNRQVTSGNAYLAAALSRRACLWCGAPVHIALTTLDDRPSFLMCWPGLTWVITCPACDWLASMYAGWSAWTHPAAQHFMNEHPRWINEPETLVDFDGQSAICARLADATSAARLTVLLLATTLQTLAVFPN
jgi:hypothetical protein